MNKRGQAVAEILLALILIVLVVSMVYLAFVLQNPKSIPTSSNSKSSNSDSDVQVKVTTTNAEPISYQQQETYYNTYPVYTTSKTNYKYPVRYTYSSDYYTYYPKDYRTCRAIQIPTDYYDYNYLKYSSWKKYESYKGIVGNDVDKFAVFVQNRDDSSG